jgi:hypothetical protein
MCWKIFNIGHKTKGDNSPVDGDINMLQQLQTQINDLTNVFRDDKEKLYGEITKLKKKEKCRCCTKGLLFNHWFLWGIIIILLGTIIFCLIPEMDITDNYASVVLGFVGILATFIVISNYAQVKEVKDESSAQITSIKDNLEKEYKKRITELNNSVDEKIEDLTATVNVLKTTVAILAKNKRTSLEPSTYKILEIDHQKVVDNYYVLVKDIPIETEYLKTFVEQFKENYCNRASNIYLLDDEIAYPPIKKYPLEGGDYITVADHFVAMVTFDADNVVLMYPYQDVMYKKYGGNNWKKDPVE